MILPRSGETVAIGVKARVLYSRMLTGEDYNVLLSSDSINDASEVLRNAPDYEEPLSVLPPRVHRIELEGAIRNSILREAEGFLPYLGGTRQAFFHSWLDRHETENIKNIFRWIHSRRLEREQMKQRLFVVPGSKVSHDLLLDSNNFAEAHEALRGTKFYPQIAAAVKRLDEGAESLFALELALDNFNERQQYLNLRKLDADEYALLIPYFGYRVDIHNLYNMMRCLLYYHMSPEEALSRILPVKYKITPRQLRYIAMGTTWDEKLERLGDISAAYAEIFDNALQGADFELLLEMSIKRAGFIKAQAIFHLGSPGFHTAVAYFLLKSYEIDDLIRIIEDVRYDRDRRSAAQYLIRPITVMEGEQAWR